MRKALVVLAALGLLVAMLIPVATSAESCCDVCPCDYEMCCANQTNWYAVSYLKKVPTGIFYQGVEMVAGVWTTEWVEAHNYDEAAELLGFRAGYNCWVGSRGAS